MVDGDNKFKGIFVEMAESLGIRMHVTGARNHKAVGVERFHKFLNHATTIFSEERGSAECFVECGMLAAYVWNAIPINGTNIIRSVLAVGRELNFPIDIDIDNIPVPIDSASVCVAKYLRHLQQDVQFSRQLLGWLIDDRRSIHRERTNERKHLVEYKPGDVVVDRIVVHSKK